MEVHDVALYFIPVRTRLVLAFGSQEVEELSVLRVAITDEAGRTGWADVPLNIPWAWPSADIDSRRKEHDVAALAEAVVRNLSGRRCDDDPLRAYFLTLAPILAEADASVPSLPRRVSMLVGSAFDIALHDLAGIRNGVSSVTVLSGTYLSSDLGVWCVDDAVLAGKLARRYPAEFFGDSARTTLPVWHLVGGHDPIETAAPQFPSLPDWIQRDGLDRIKVKCNGTDVSAAAARLRLVRSVAKPLGITRISVDFNGTLPDQEALDRFLLEAGDATEALAMVEQPFAAMVPLLSENGDLRRTGGSGPLIVPDESIESWRDLTDLRSRGYDGAVLKTAKGFSEMVVALAVARCLEVPVFVQDLTNPMLAMISHAVLGRMVGGDWGIEANASQYYPDASEPEASVHPGLFHRRNGRIDLGTIGGPGMGYRIEQIPRRLPERAA